MERVTIRKESIMVMCKHYDQIVSYVYHEDDCITKMLINYYRDYMDAINLDSMEEIDLIYHYDEALAYYLDNSKFYRLVQEKYNNQNDWGNFIIKNLIHLYEVYQDMVQAKVAQSKWL